MVSKVDIVNMGLFNAGTASTITSIDPSDGSTEADTASVLYQPQIDSLMRSAHWNFARKQDLMTLLKAAQGTPENPDGSLPTPLQPWLYEYAYPDTCLKARFILPLVNTQGTNPPLMTGIALESTLVAYQASIPFVVGLDTDDNGNLIKVILTNASMAQLVYTIRVLDPNLWDQNFVIAASALLGLFFVNPLARNTKLFTDLGSMLKGVVEQARISDGNEGTPQFDHIPDWIRVRELGGGLWLGPGGAYPCWYGWDSLAYPGGWV
jgi:hypothetical protein